MNTVSERTDTRQAAVHGLAVVGFIALVAAGIWLAIYSTRYVPTVVGSIGSAAVYLGSVFTPSSEPTLSVIPPDTAATSSPSDTASTTAATSTVPATPAPARPKPATTAGEKTSTTSPITNAPAALSGLPDLVVHINAVGYLATTSASSFVASTTVPSGSRPAVVFTIKNIGTNMVGPWRWSASIPTQTSYIYQSQPQQALNPGDSIEYTLGFDQANRGSGQMISVTANFDRAVAELNTDNNSAAATLTILGG